MKKLLIVFAILTFVCGVAFAVTVPTPAGDYDIIGAEGLKQETSIRILKLVRNPVYEVDTAGLNSEEAVVYDTVTGDGVTVVTTTTSGDATFAGILVTALATADTAATSPASHRGRGNWGYICVHGPAVAEVGGDNDASAGDAFWTSTDATKVTGWGTSQSATDVDALAGKKQGGFFLSTPADSTDQSVFVTAL